ncbi:hypothetical protein QJ854_gp307 [Moumouvirus goulette]|uniref:Uncharacterized protein n=1 Tax=Moumouvirus goulette TaxID=1247379 RepID=M1NN60_9VIRU|nr:hypothetical protein QJ854_gp307 [Moumouvirus goulette]AGF85475.1 hypothetical protein glt_00667 [Moumouvirus goulette]
MSTRNKKTVQAQVETEEQTSETSSENVETPKKGSNKKSQVSQKDSKSTGKSSKKTETKGGKSETKSTKTENKGSKGSKTSKQTTKKGSQTGNKKSTKSKEESKDRYFKLVDPKTNESYGRYTGGTPKQAASKAYTKTIQKLKSEKKPIPKQSTIILRESTRGSPRKYYGYEASRLKLDKPQELTINTDGQEKIIVYHFRNKIKKIPVPEQLGGSKSSRSNKKSQSNKNTSTKSSGSKRAGNKASGKSSSKSTASKKKWFQRR